MKKSLFFIFCLLLSVKAFSNESRTLEWLNPEKPTEAKFGIYITELYNLDWHKESVNLSFWAWFISDMKDYQPILHTEVVNSSKVEIENFYSVNLKDGKYLSTAKFRTRLIQVLDVAKFPFISQKMQVWIESGELDKNAFIMIPDKENSYIDRDVNLQGWYIDGFDIYEETKTYQTNFGTTPRGDGSSQFSRIVAEVTLKSKSSEKFFSIFGVMYLAFFLSLCALFVPPGELNSKIGFLVASIFAAIGNKFVLDAYLPSIGSLSLINRIELLTFGFIGLAAVLVLITCWFYRSRHIVLGRVVEFSAGFLFLLLYITFNWIWIYSAMG